MPDGNITRKEVYNEFQKQEKKIMLEVDEKLDKVLFEARFDPIQKIVYGLVGAVLMSVIAAVLALVIRGAS